MDLGLKGKVAIVTGSSRGIGRSIALGLAEEGCRVVLTARHEEPLTQVAEEARARGGEPLVVAADLTQRGQGRTDQPDQAGGPGAGPPSGSGSTALPPAPFSSRGAPGTGVGRPTRKAWPSSSGESCRWASAGRRMWPTWWCSSPRSGRATSRGPAGLWTASSPTPTSNGGWHEYWKGFSRLRLLEGTTLVPSAGTLDRIRLRVVLIWSLSSGPP